MLLQGQPLQYLDAEETQSQKEEEPEMKIEKRRGRKRERDDKYFEKTTEHINNLKTALKNCKETNMPIQERRRLRNQVSAMQSRILRRTEVIFLNR